ncbi:hypothetical protein BGW41_005597 [Actinomortierella wolfii]|nr:hypothetical protein BGW41_005597 [Actinomortierella wolfii]
MQALYGVGVELQECPDESLPDILAYLVPMITEPVQEFCDTIAKIVKSAKLYCRQTVSLHENSLQKYYGTPGKRLDPSRDNQLATTAFETKKEMCKAIYALSATLNNAIMIKESFIIEKDAFKDIQVANLRQTLIRPVNVDARDYVFEICSIDVYLMESVLQAATKVDFDEWKAALSAWIPPDEDIPAIEDMKIKSPPPAKSIFPRARHISLNRAPEAVPTSPRQRISAEFPIVKKYRAKPMRSQTMVGMWKKITCCIRSNGLFLQFNGGDIDIPFETIPLFTLPRTHISNIDNSLFSKKHCFSIRTAHHVNYYTVSPVRSRNDQEVLNGWLYALKSFAKPEVFGADVYSEYRVYRTFSVKVNDGKLNKDVEAYCEITLDDERRARTGSRSRHTKGIEPGTPFWRDSFTFSDLPPFRKGITINVIQVKGSKQLPIGQVDIPVHHRKEWDEGWYPINAHRARSNQHEGDLRLKLRYEEQIVLPMESYGPLLDMILNFQENNVISKLAELVTDLESYAKNVLHILEAKGMATVWLNSLIDEEIAQASPKSVNTLFRANTLLTKALDAYMRLVGTEYLDDTLGDILRTICASKSVCEVDPSRLERGHDDLKSNWRTLYHHTRVCWKAVTDSVPIFPKELQVVFSHLQMRLTEKFKDPIPSDDADKEDLAALARYTGVSGFVFLRLICPAILGPKLFCIMREHPEAKAHRTLTLIAKSLQGLANLVMFGNKESWMVPMNEFIKENIQSLKDFIDRICMAEPMSPTRAASETSSVRSVPIYPPQSPASATSAVFRTTSLKTPNVANGNTTSGSGGSNVNHLYKHSNQSSTSAPASHLQHHAPPPPPMIFASATTTSGTSVGSTSMVGSSSSPRTSPSPFFNSFVPERADELPILPYLIDLGKELASFSTTVANLTSLTPSSSSLSSSSSATTTITAATQTSDSSNASSLTEGGAGGEMVSATCNGAGGGGSSGSTRPSYDHPSYQKGLYSGRDGVQVSSGGEQDEEDILHPETLPCEDGENDVVRRVHRICLDLVEEVEVRVAHTAQVEEDRRSLSGASSVHNHGLGLGLGLGLSAGTRDKLSREESRNSEEASVGGLMGYMTTAAGLHPSIHHYQYYQHQGQPCSLQQQQRQLQQQQYLMFEHYGCDDDEAAQLASYYYYYGMEEYDSEDEGPV